MQSKRHHTRTDAASSKHTKQEGKDRSRNASRESSAAGSTPQAFADFLSADLSDTIPDESNEFESSLHFATDASNDDALFDFSLGQAGAPSGNASAGETQKCLQVMKVSVTSPRPPLSNAGTPDIFSDFLVDPYDPSSTRTTESTSKEGRPSTDVAPEVGTDQLVLPPVPEGYGYSVDDPRRRFELNDKFEALLDKFTESSTLCKAHAGSYSIKPCPTDVSKRTPSLSIIWSLATLHIGPYCILYLACRHDDFAELIDIRSVPSQRSGKNHAYFVKNRLDEKFPGSADSVRNTITDDQVVPVFKNEHRKFNDRSTDWKRYVPQQEYDDFNLEEEFAGLSLGSGITNTQPEAEQGKSEVFDPEQFLLENPNLGTNFFDTTGSSQYQYDASDVHGDVATTAVLHPPVKPTMAFPLPDIKDRLGQGYDPEEIWKEFTEIANKGLNEVFLCSAHSRWSASADCYISECPSSNRRRTAECGVYTRNFPVREWIRKINYKYSEQGLPARANGDKEKLLIDSICTLVERFRFPLEEYPSNMYTQISAGVYEEYQHKKEALDDHITYTRTDTHQTYLRDYEAYRLAVSTYTREMRLAAVRQYPQASPSAASAVGHTHHSTYEYYAHNTGMEEGDYIDPSLLHR
ncbi:uncharacterized protein L199_007402 [Kwoniella botswanensis]|uniref:uncharacterized protein n=1 Tax=Kwoniella botswanensis TaxID=1268659 RepID=UPI00315CF7ED